MYKYTLNDFTTLTISPLIKNQSNYFDYLPFFYHNQYSDHDSPPSLLLIQSISLTSPLPYHFIARSFSLRLLPKIDLSPLLSVLCSSPYHLLTYSNNCHFTNVSFDSNKQQTTTIPRVLHGGIFDDYVK